MFVGGIFDTNVGPRPNLARMCGWRRDWLSPKKNCPNPTPEGFRGLFMFVACEFVGCLCVGCLWVAFSTRTSDRAQIWHARADGDETGSHQKKIVPTPPQRGLGGYLCLWHVGLWDVCVWDVCGWHFRHKGRTAPKFGTHVRMETRLALTKKN